MTKANISPKELSEGYINHIMPIISKGGPEPWEYNFFDSWLHEIYRLMKKGIIGLPEIEFIRSCFGEALSLQTLQGHALNKPHGYSGDYEIIDKIYQQHVTPNSRLANWDRYLHHQAGAKAIRNRKAYFHDILNNTACVAGNETLRILNVASGPCRDIFEFLKTNPDKNVHFDCVEHDINAINYADSLCKDYSAHVSFINRNALRFKTGKKYHFIWSGGLFDYFDDRIFQIVLKKLLNCAEQGGQIIIGNFSSSNPTKYYMEIFGWVLYLRSPEQLISLAEECGVPSDNIKIGREPEGVNLFLHIHY